MIVYLYDPDTDLAMGECLLTKGEAAPENSTTTPPPDNLAADETVRWTGDTWEVVPVPPAKQPPDPRWLRICEIRGRLDLIDRATAASSRAASLGVIGDDDLARLVAFEAEALTLRTELAGTLDEDDPLSDVEGPPALDDVSAQLAVLDHRLALYDRMQIRPLAAIASGQAEEEDFQALQGVEALKEQLREERAGLLATESTEAGE